MNNAGYGVYGPFVKNALADELGMQLNMTALVVLTKLYLPGMVATKSGKILNMASTAAFQPWPIHGAVLRHQSVRAFLLRGDRQ